MTLSSAYIELFIRVKKSGGNVRGEMSRYRTYTALLDQLLATAKDIHLDGHADVDGQTHRQSDSRPDDITLAHAVSSDGRGGRDVSRG